MGISAKRLRQAATVLRERATAASEGPWSFEPLGSEGIAIKGKVPDKPRRLSRTTIARCTHESWDEDRDNARYIATMEPRIGIALADWLEQSARRLDYGQGSAGDYHRPLEIAGLIIGDA